MKIRLGPGELQFRLDDLELRDVAGLETVAGDVPEPLGKLGDFCEARRLGSRQRQIIIPLARGAADLALQSGNIYFREAALLVGLLDTMPPLASEFERLVEEDAFMRLVPQGGEIERGVGARAGDANPRLRHRPAAARSYKVKVVPVGERQGLGQAQRANRHGLLRDRERCGRGILAKVANCISLAWQLRRKGYRQALSDKPSN